MKKWWQTVFLLLLICWVFAFMACPTTPPVPEPKAEYEQAKTLRSRIQNLKFSPYAPDEYAAAEADFASGEAALNKDNAKAKAYFENAITNYRQVIKKAIAVKSKAKEDNIGIWKKKNDDLKAAVADPQAYQEAEQTLAQAKAAAEQDNWEEAERLYGEAADKYQKLYDTVKAKKDKAENKYKDTNTILDSLNY